MADSDTQVAPDTLVSEIETTRADLARTIDAIADRVSPRNATRRAVDRARERLSELDPAVIGTAAAVAAVAVTALLVLRRRRGSS